MADTNPLSDQQIDEAYQHAISTLAPSPLLDKRIRSLAEQKLAESNKAKPQRQHSWAAPSLWASAASIAGVGLIIWTLWQPVSLPHDPEIDNTASLEMLADATIETETLQDSQRMMAKAQRPQLNQKRTKSTELRAVAPLSLAHCISQALAKEPLDSLKPNKQPVALNAELLAITEPIIWNNQQWQLYTDQQQWLLKTKPSTAAPLWLSLPQHIQQACTDMK